MNDERNGSKNWVEIVELDGLTRELWWPISGTVDPGKLRIIFGIALELWMDDFRLSAWLCSWENSVDTEINFHPFDRVLRAIPIRTVCVLVDFVSALAIFYLNDAGRLLLVLLGFNTLNGWEFHVDDAGETTMYWAQNTDRMDLIRICIGVTMKQYHIGFEVL